MNIKELKEKYKNSLPDIKLEGSIELVLRVNYVPNKLFEGEYIILEDETGNLDAITKKKSLFDILKSKVESKHPIKIKGDLDKTEFENIVFGIEEILETKS